MATKKRKSTKRRTAARRKKAEQRLPAGLGTLFGGLLLIVLAFVRGDSVWRVLHDVLFGLFGCGSFVLGAAVCCLAVLYTRGEELLSRILKLVLGLIFVCGTVIVFSDIQPQGLSALQMLSACYANGVNAWLSGGAIGFVLGGVLLLLTPAMETIHDKDGYMRQYFENGAMLEADKHTGTVQVFDKDGTVRREVKHCTIEQLYVEQTFAGGL